MIGPLFALTLVAALPPAVALAVGSLGVATSRPVGRIALAAVLPAVVALGLAPGPIAAALVSPWLATVVGLGVVGLWALVRPVRIGRSGPAPQQVGVAVAIGFLAVGAGWLLLDRLGIRPMGLDPTIVLLTAVHFHVAGFVLTLAGVLAAAARPGRFGATAVVGLVIGMPLTSLGFIGFPIAGWVGAVVVGLAGIGIGLTTLRAAAGEGRTVAGILLGVAGLSLFVTMPLAIAYATETTFGISTLGISAMVALHGTLNVVGVAIPAMLGWSLVE